jgi:hypothetical protein
MRSEFVVIDLFSQYEAVNHHVAGWSQSRILSWLRQFGQVRLEGLDEVGVTHVFRSVSGLEMPFTFDDRDRILIPGFVFHIRADQRID